MDSLLPKFTACQSSFNCGTNEKGTKVLWTVWMLKEKQYSFFIFYFSKISNLALRPRAKNQAKYILITSKYWKYTYDILGVWKVSMKVTTVSF